MENWLKDRTIGLFLGVVIGIIVTLMLTSGASESVKADGDKVQKVKIEGPIEIKIISVKGGSSQTQPVKVKVVK